MSECIRGHPPSWSRVISKRGWQGGHAACAFRGRWQARDLFVAVAITYIALAGLFNRTTVRVNRDQLRLRIGPLPWIGNLIIDCNEIDQLYSTEKKKVVRADNYEVHNASALLHAISAYW